MGTATHHAPGRAFVVFGNVDRDTNSICTYLESPQSFSSQINYIEYRRVHHAQNSAALLDQCNIDREFAIAFDELLGAIQRIDQPIAPCAIRAGKIPDRFLGEYR